MIASDSKTVSSININSIYRTNVKHSCKWMNQIGPIRGEGGLVIPLSQTHTHWKSEKN